MNMRQIFLLFVAMGLFPIALSYGFIPQTSLNYLFDFEVSSPNMIHIFRAVMGLYLALIIFWVIGAFKVHLRQAALYSLIVFMFGLGGGRVLSLILDGTPHWLLLVYTALEFAFGAMGILLLNNKKELEHSATQAVA